MSHPKSKKVRSVEFHARAPESVESNEIDFVCSTDMVASDGHIINQRGWDFANFERGTRPMLWNHDTSLMPLGYWKNWRIEKRDDYECLVMTACFGQSDRAQEAKEACNHGSLNAVSVGWESDDYEPIKDKEGRETGGVRFNTARLLECSLVNLPADEYAVQMRTRSAGQSQTTEDGWELITHSLEGIAMKIRNTREEEEVLEEEIVEEEASMDEDEEETVEEEAARSEEEILEEELVEEEEVIEEEAAREEEILEEEVVEEEVVEEEAAREEEMAEETEAVEEEEVIEEQSAADPIFVSAVEDAATALVDIAAVMGDDSVDEEVMGEALDTLWSVVDSLAAVAFELAPEGDPTGEGEMPAEEEVPVEEVAARAKKTAIRIGSKISKGRAAKLSEARDAARHAGDRLDEVLAEIKKEDADPAPRAKRAKKARKVQGADSIKDALQGLTTYLDDLY